MAAYVLDSSVAASWCFPDEQTSYSKAALLAINPSGAVAPRLLAYEIRNTVLIGVRRRRITQGQAADFLRTLARLPIRLTDPASYDDVFALAERHNLSMYDASYLDLAVREHMVLATLDSQLVRSALAEGIGLFQP
jgi:predicted nucleic acid-binding protein